MIQRLVRFGIRTVGKLALLPLRELLGTITHVRTGDAIVALTFDDGPDPSYTPRLLDVLERHHARVTFFMTGQSAERHPELVRRIALAGHSIGNHSWDHPSFPLVSGRERRAQIRACQRALAPYGDRLFRPPYGDQNFASRLDATLLGYKVIMFDVAADDWCGGDAAMVAEQLESRVHPGCVIVLHDRLFNASSHSCFDREPMIAAIDRFLERAENRFRFVTVAELLARGKPQKEFWCKQTAVEFLNTLIREEAPDRRYREIARPRWSEVVRTVFLKTPAR